VGSYQTHLALATAIAVGLLIGLEREQSRPEGDEGKTLLGGVRTYPIFALVGALATLLAPASTWFPLVALLGVVALVAISYSDSVRRHGDHGVTTEASVLATFLLGATATSHVIEPISARLLLVAMVGVALTFLLSSKTWFHNTVARVSRADFYATVKFLIVVVIVLPLLPHRNLGPVDAIDPFQLGLMVVTIASLSFLGYVATRWFGARRGMLLGAALGGLVSSTAVTLAFSRRARSDPSLAPIAAGAIGVASLIMIIRVAVLVAVVDPDLLVTLVWPLATMALGCGLGTLLVFRRDPTPREHQPVPLTNPFELSSAIKVGLMFGVVTLATKAATVYLGDRGLFVAAGLAGTTDVDAVTLSTAKLATGGLTETAAEIAIFIAIAVNTIVKTGFAFVVGTPALGRRVAVIGVLGIVGGAAGILLGRALG
jgi:uncharacterized membrane protein (DUF4010 family)